MYRRQILQVNTRLKTLDEITSAPWDSNLKTKKNASGKRPPDEAHGPGDETIRPQRSSEAERSSEKNVHNARCSDSARRGCTESKNICLWCEARAQMVQLALCSARMSMHNKISLFLCFVILGYSLFFKYEETANTVY